MADGARFAWQGPCAWRRKWSISERKMQCPEWTRQLAFLKSSYLF